MTTSLNLPEQPEALIGTWRRFGQTGPAYQVVGLAPQVGNGDLFMRIQVVETGEELDYRVSDILGDPREA